MITPQGMSPEWADLDLGCSASALVVMSCTKHTAGLSGRYFSAAPPVQGPSEW
jgi:hypothetical protein